MRPKRGPYKVPRHEVTQPLDPSYRLIPLTQGQNALVDAADFERIAKWNWCALWSTTGRSFYAARSSREKPRFMHSMVRGMESDQRTDHRNGDTLDNRKENLRAATRSQNGANRGKQRNNSSGYKGIAWMRRIKKWQASIHTNHRRIYLGVFDSKEDAARAYDTGAHEIFGEFAKLNFPLNPPH
jgi:hypothetical protein